MHQKCYVWWVELSEDMYVICTGEYRFIETYLFGANDNVLINVEVCICSCIFLMDNRSHSGDLCIIPSSVMEVLKFVSWM